MDWWGLGVCLYEFLVGIPPFTDETPELVFRRILSGEVEFPEGLSVPAMESVRSLLVLDPDHRVKMEGLKQQRLFEGKQSCTERLSISCS